MTSGLSFLKLIKCEGTLVTQGLSLKEAQQCLFGREYHMADDSQNIVHLDEGNTAI